MSATTPTRSTSGATKPAVQRSPLEDLINTMQATSDFNAALLRPRAMTSRSEASHPRLRSEEHTSELQSLMRNSYAVFCLKKKHINNHQHEYHMMHKQHHHILIKNTQQHTKKISNK